MDKLKDYRKAAGLTLREVQDITGISNAYLSQLETGKIRRPSANVLYKLAKVYGINLENLLIESGLVESNINIPTPALKPPTMTERIEKLEKEMESVRNKSFLTDQLI